LVRVEPWLDKTKEYWYLTPDSSSCILEFSLFRLGGNRMEESPKRERWGRGKKKEYSAFKFRRLIAIFNGSPSTHA